MLQSELRLGGNMVLQHHDYRGQRCTGVANPVWRCKTPSNLTPLHHIGLFEPTETELVVRATLARLAINGLPKLAKVRTPQRLRGQD